jgi:hypothetical protein
MSDQHDFSPVRAFDENGLPVPAAEARFFLPGTSAPVDVFADSDETILHPVPMLANGAGVFPAVWCSQLIRAEVKDPSGVMLPGYPMEIAMRSFGGNSGASAVTFSPTPDIPETDVQTAIEGVFDALDARLDGLGDLAALDAITTAQIAPSALRTAAEGVGAPLDTEMPTVNSMTTHVEAVRAALPFTVKGPAIADQATTPATPLTLAHGLGVIPRLIQVSLVCITNEGGYLAGEIYGPIAAETFADGADKGVGVAANSTNIRVVIGSAGISLLNATTGVRFTITPANWRLRVETWK